MKKITITLFLLIPLMTFSQNEFAVIGGISNSFLSEGILEKVPVEDKFGVFIGGVYEHMLTEKVSFRPKLIFSLQGDREKGGSFSTSAIDYKLTYLNIPLNFKFFSKPYLLIGPQIGFLLDTKKGDFDFGEPKTFDFGFDFGIGIDIKDFFIEFNAYQGISNVIEINDLKATNTVLQLGFGYMFN
jgi:Outer membrane protein beta-barrel domain